MKIKFNLLNRVVVMLGLIIFCIHCSYAALDKECFSKLQAGGEVDLYGKHIENNGAMEIADVLKHSSHITTLKLRENNIGNAGVQALAEALTTNTALTTLDLEENNIDDGGVQTLAEALKNNPTLTTLNMRFNNIGDDGAQALAELLTISTALTTLDLEGNNIGDMGAQVLATALMTNTALITLRLRLNNFGAASVQALLDVTILNFTLREVGIQGLSSKQAQILNLVFIRNKLIVQIMPAIKRRIFHILQIDGGVLDTLPELIRQEFSEEIARIKEMQIEIYTLNGWEITPGLRRIGQHILSSVPRSIFPSFRPTAEESMAPPRQNSTDVQIIATPSRFGILSRICGCTLQ